MFELIEAFQWLPKDIMDMPVRIRGIIVKAVERGKEKNG